MAYDEELAERMRKVLLERGAFFTEKRMMGGICFFLDGNMLCGADRARDGMRRLMFRVGKDKMEEALARPGATAMEMGGRTMGGFVFVDADGCDDQALGAWIDLARSFVETLPPK